MNNPEKSSDDDPFSYTPEEIASYMANAKAAFLAGDLAKVEKEYAEILAHPEDWIPLEELLKVLEADNDELDFSDYNSLPS